MTLKPGQRSDYQICLSDPRGKKNDWYLQLDGGFEGAEIDFLSEDSQNIYIRSVGKRLGDFDEQRDWKGGRGGESFSDDPAKFYDAENCWTLSSGVVTPTLLWQYATGYRTVDQYMPGSGRSVSWQSLIGVKRYIASDPLAATTAADKAKLWLRRVGTPGTLTLEIRAADTGEPNGTIRKTVTKTTSDVTDVISKFLTFDWTSTQNITAGDYLVVYGASTDNNQNHWEIAVDAAGTASKNSTAGTGTWDASAFSLYYRITDADVARRWYFFNNGSFCAVDSKDTGGGTSVLYTIDSGGTATVVSTPGLGTVTSRPAVGNSNNVYFPQGEAVNIRRWDGATSFIDDGTNKASFLARGHDQTSGPVMWKANSTQGGTTTVARSADLTAGTLVYGSAIPIGNNNAPINGIYFWQDNALYAFKTDSAWKVSKNTSGTDVATMLQWGLENTPSASNGVFALGAQQFLYFPWLFSLIRLYGTQLDDVGQGWGGAGLPSGREGSFVAGCAYVNFQFYALDAGTSGVSSVMCYDGVTWHEVFRAPSSGERIRDVAIQPISGARAKLWIDCGGDLIYMILPLNKARPVDDSSAMYQHEGVLYSSTIDAGAASKLPKLIKSMTATTENLNGAGIRIECEYQVDDKIGLDGYANWIRLQPFLLSPESTIQVGANNITQFRYRLRLLTDTNTTPPKLKGIVPNGLARGETKTVWSLRVKGDRVTVGGKTTDPNELLKYLMEAQENPGSVVMTSTNPLFHDYAVELSVQRIKPITDTKSVFILNLVSV